MARVSWFGAAAYANWRSAQQGREPSYDLSIWECDFEANGYRLPTEAEWEYAARGGYHPECTEVPEPYCRYPWGDTIDGSNANYENSGDPYEAGDWPWTTPVGYYDGNQTPPGEDMANGYGLYDMAGNVYDLCWDRYRENWYSQQDASEDDTRGPDSGTDRVGRGCCWYADSSYLRCAGRDCGQPSQGVNMVGFRCVRSF